MPNQKLHPCLYICFFILLTFSIPTTYSTTSTTQTPTTILHQFKEAPKFYNSHDCPSTNLDDHVQEQVLNLDLTGHTQQQIDLLMQIASGFPRVGMRKYYHNICYENAVHVAMTLDAMYIRGSMAAILSVLQHSSCPQNIIFHFVTSISANASLLRATIANSFPYLKFRVYHFDDNAVARLISTSIRSALDCPLNYARTYLSDILPDCVHKIVYLDSDLILVDDIAKLSETPLGEDSVLAAPEYCNANFTSYFTPTFWSNPSLSLTFANREACYFNTGVMVIDLDRWRLGDYTTKIEEWMELQKRMRIYELGSLPPFLLVFAGKIASVDHKWNQHGLGGDNIRGLCRNLHPGRVSLLHWSGKGKPWVRLDANRPCPLDALWAPYDLLKPTFSFDS